MDIKENVCMEKRAPNEELALFIKEELTDDCNFIDLCVKEEVASIYDEEEGYTLNCSFNNEEVKTEPIVFAVCDRKAVSSLEHLVQNGRQSSNSLQIKSSRNQKRKLKAKGQMKFVQKANDCMTKSGRISRDEIFKNKEYYCSQCEKHYLGRKCFKKHFKLHFTIEQNRCKCLMCYYTSRTVSHINRHILETHFIQYHNDEKLFNCYLCEKRFHDKKDLERHIFSHTGEGALRCGECSYTAFRKHRLENHMSVVHGYPRSTKAKAETKDDSLFMCDYCNYSCTEKASLRSHIKRHMGYKTHECPKCDYKCTDGGDLQKHSTIHSDQRPFVCNGCKKTFKRRSHLLIHFNGKYCCGGLKRIKRKSKDIKV